MTPIRRCVCGYLSESMLQILNISVRYSIRILGNMKTFTLVLLFIHVFELSKAEDIKEKVPQWQNLQCEVKDKTIT